MIPCKGHWSESTPDSPSEFSCDWPNSEGFSCSECIINGGAMSPVSGKKFRGNREPYDRLAEERYKAWKARMDAGYSIHGW